MMDTGLLPTSGTAEEKIFGLMHKFETFLEQDGRPMFVVLLGNDQEWLYGKSQFLEKPKWRKTAEECHLHYVCIGDVFHHILQSKIDYSHPTENRMTDDDDHDETIRSHQTLP
jgi:hypothetical protein